MGISIIQNVTLQNNTNDLKETLTSAQKRTHIIITEDLGPDEEDIPKTRLAEYLDCSLILDNKTDDCILSHHENSGFPMPN